MSIYLYERKKFIAFFLVFALVFCLISLLIANACKKGPSRPAELPTDNTKSGVTVVIDAGHGGEDGGAVGVNGVYEKDINLNIALTLYELLRESGIDTVLTRSEDILLYDKSSDYSGHKKEQDLAERKRITESIASPIFVSIHMNSFTEEKYSGLQVYFSQNNEDSRALAEGITAVVKSSLQPKNERVPKEAGDRIYLLRNLACPAVLVECGFLSNRAECERLSDPEYQKELALCLAVAIKDHVGKG